MQIPKAHGMSNFRHLKCISMATYRFVQFVVNKTLPKPFGQFYGAWRSLFVVVVVSCHRVLILRNGRTKGHTAVGGRRVHTMTPTFGVSNRSHLFPLPFRRSLEG